MSQHIFINISSININVYSVVLKFLHTDRQTATFTPSAENIHEHKIAKKYWSHLKILAPEM